MKKYLLFLLGIIMLGMSSCTERDTPMSLDLKANLLIAGFFLLFINIRAKMLEVRRDRFICYASYQDGQEMYEDNLFIQFFALFFSISCFILSEISDINIPFYVFLFGSSMFILKHSYKKNLEWILWIEFVVVLVFSILFVSYFTNTHYALRMFFVSIPAFVLLIRANSVGWEKQYGTQYGRRKQKIELL